MISANSFNFLINSVMFSFIIHTIYVCTYLCVQSNTIHNMWLEIVAKFILYTASIELLCDVMVNTSRNYVVHINNAIH